MTLDIWSKIKKGNQEGYERLYDTYIDELYAYGISVSKDKEIVMDCIHDLFLDLYKYRKNLSDTTNIKYYLISSLKRKIIRADQHRIKEIQFIPDYLVSEENEVVSFEEELIQIQLDIQKKQYLDTAITNLTDQQQRGIQLRFYEGKSYQDIASSLNVSIETSRTILYRAIKRLREELNLYRIQA